MIWLSIPIAAFLVLGLAGNPLAHPDERLQASWQSYQERHIMPDGRVVDDGNGGISHSEGQGYALLLAAELDDPGLFARLWSWTRNNLLIRDDGLAAWRYDPEQTPAITDINNASDGDLLIAHALALAGRKWERSDYLEQARLLARTIREDLIRVAGGYTLLLPGAEGFVSNQGHVVNPSYWIFHSLEELQKVDPDPQWEELYASGLELLHAVTERYGTLPDWVAVSAGGELLPPEGFDWVTGYNALRMPLYLRLAGYTEGPLFDSFQRHWGNLERSIPVVRSLSNPEEVEYSQDPGFLGLRLLLTCEGPAGLPALSEDSLYYPATLLLFTHLVRVREISEC